MNTQGWWAVMKHKKRKYATAASGVVLIHRETTTMDGRRGGQTGCIYTAHYIKSARRQGTNLQLFAVVKEFSPEKELCFRLKEL